MSASKHYFYRLDSGGVATNLQLYALIQARSHWDAVAADYARDGDLTHLLHERCAFAVAAMGLSVVQLLGQNPVSVPVKRVGGPEKLLSAFVDQHDLDPRLKRQFKRFMGFYDAVRHFGVTKKGSKHAKVGALTFDAARECMETGLRVWREVRAVNGRKPGDPLYDLDLDRLGHIDHIFEEEEDPGQIL